MLQFLHEEKMLLIVFWLEMEEKVIARITVESSVLGYLLHLRH